MALPNTWYSPRQPKIQHNSKQHKQTPVSSHQTNGTEVPQGISPNIPTIISHILSSNPLLINKTHPAPGNRLCILSNMARSHIITNYKLSPRFRNNSQNAPWPTEDITIFSSCWNCNAYINQGRIKYKLNPLPVIWLKRKYIFWPYWVIFN